VLATGGLSVPNAPRFKGLESFAGPVYHTAQWPREPVDFSRKRVGVIGTGSSGVQAIPLIAAQARELTVFQRTPCYVVPAHNGPLDREYEAQIKGDYAEFRARNRAMFGAMSAEWAPAAPSAHSVSDEARQAVFEERWRIGGFSLLWAFADILLDPRSNALAAEFVRNRIRSIVRDPETARRLSPTYPIGCKRLCVGTGYYETYNRPNVRLVDLAERPIEEITPAGVRVDGREHLLDALVLATGFDAMTGALTSIDLRGRGGVTIQQKWRAGPLNYLGLTVAGFPNMFLVAGAGSAAAFTNVIKSIEHHIDWIGDCIRNLDAQGYSTIEATEQAESNWVGLVNSVAEQTVLLGCNSWYLGANIPGKARVFMPFAGGYPTYVEQCAAVARNDYEGFELR
jgi:cyclohexanone monooxygenase